MWLLRAPAVLAEATYDSVPGAAEAGDGATATSPTAGSAAARTATPARRTRPQAVLGTPLPGDDTVLTERLNAIM